MENWQDKVIMVVGFMFGFMLLPQVIDGITKGLTVNSITAFLTAIGLYILAYTFYTLDLKKSTLANLFSGSMWSVLLILSLML